MQSDANPSPHPVSLLTPKLTGNFARFWPSAAILVSVQRVNSIASSQIPYATEQGIFDDVSGKVFATRLNNRDLFVGGIE
jgi:hypothetical protein